MNLNSSLLVFRKHFTTVSISFFKAIFRAQAELDVADNIKGITIFVEKKSIETEVAIFDTKTDLYDVPGTNGVLTILLSFLLP